ncbi:DUF4167 domain-containing protein [Roseibium sp.]|uniref:DUF4167 domain-containing protein n=1 Tax=Roseibium sp. TaxID=1936156 RepID=UPI003A972F0C
MRGRGRKGPNPLSRTYESNGPDVKIRGTALHIAEKYQQLARDAQASGDRIMSENYFQHAEHYLRIVAAAQPQQAAASQFSRDAGEDGDQDVQGQSDAPMNGGSERRPRHERGKRQDAEALVGEDSPQPFIDDMPVIDESGQLNGSSSRAADASSDEDDEDAKPRRRIRGTRGKGVRKSADEGEAAGDQDVVDTASAGGEDEAVKPKRRTTRTRRPKVAEQGVDAEPVTAGE